MIKVLIVEDELPARNRITKILQSCDFEIEITGICDSVESTIEWLTKSETPDLAFFDIQLADGLSFEIFDYQQIDFPIIFTTAYNQYALQAFEANGIDYLLKPINLNKLTQSLTKFQNLVGKRDQQSLNFISSLENNTYKSRFLVKAGDKLRSIPVSEIVYFVSFEKATKCLTKDGKNYLIDIGVDKVASQLDSKLFFRVNRQQIIKLESIVEIYIHSNSRLKVSINPGILEEIIVARERVKEFKIWLDA